MYQRYKNINLNKIQRSNERMSQDKESLKSHKDSLQIKRSANSVHSSREFWAVSMYIEQQKNRLVDKISRINSKIKGPQICCIPQGRRGLAKCKSTCEEHAGSDKSFENFTKEKRTVKTLVLSREANMLPQCKSRCKAQAGSDKKLSVKPCFLKLLF